MASIDYAASDPLVTNYAWAAGIVDGEGHIGATIRSAQASRPNHMVRAIRLTVPQTDPQMLERLPALFGGRIRKRGEPKPNHKQRWDYTLSGGPRVIKAIELMWPWLGTVKRQQALAAIDIWTGSPRLVTNRNIKTIEKLERDIVWLP